ncbi:cytochrome d ubiquinol oxidase subunit II [Caldalkalibacillus salinus]|uniref:cytochrome d ubiquinol oxidase subunit II n=1 Tax=Caldalkalibacillus salinus TaxID=2803787 RepID=UPI001923EB7A|nr:cytochrome d ubiquinol oxidase subunit II [Caldalkalibacillus salinus]
MTDMLIAITLLWIFVFIYAIAGSIDFGAGFWSMLYMNQKGHKATDIANKYLSPSWEVTNVFVVLIVIGLVSFFPGATFTLGTVLLVPGSLVVLLLLIRSALLVFSNQVHEYRKLLTMVSGVTGLLIPALLISVLPISQGGYVDIVNGFEQLNYGKLLTSPQLYAFMGLAISSTLFMSSLLLADYARVSHRYDAFKIYQRDAIAVGPIAFFFALLTLLSMRSESTWLYENIIEYIGWLILSFVFFALGYICISSTKKKTEFNLPRVAVVAAILQYLFASYAYGAAHLPYLVYPHVTLASGFTHPNTFRALFIMYIVGFAILLPGFIYFWKLFMKDEGYLRKQK